jgi:hypothetical protein
MLKKSALCLALLASIAAPAGATTVTVADDGQWNEFFVDNQSAPLYGLDWIDINDGSVLSFSIDLTARARLTVVDGAFGGDQFRVFDSGVLLSLTSVATDTYPDSLYSDFDAALLDSDYSRAFYILGIGHHTITGSLYRSALDDANQPLNATNGAISVTTVPEPATLGLMLLGMGLSASMRRRAK